jgi:hypothetical protein
VGHWGAPAQGGRAKSTNQAPSVVPLHHDIVQAAIGPHSAIIGKLMFTNAPIINFSKIFGPIERIREDIYH